MCTITGGGERLHDVLRLIGSMLACLFLIKSSKLLVTGQA